MSTYRTVILKGQLGRRYEESRAGVAIKPGYLIEEYSASGVDKVKPHATAGGNTRRLLAIEDGYDGTVLNSTKAIGDLVRYVEALAGEIVALWVAAGASAIALDAKLESAGDGTVRVLASGTPLFQAKEAVDNSGGGSAVQIKAAVM